MLKKIVFVILLVLLSACNVDTNEDSDILDDIDIIKPSEKLFWGREDNVLYISAAETEHSVNENTSVLNSKDINKEDVPWYIGSWEKYSYIIEKVIIEKTDIPIVPTSMRYWFANMKDLKEIEGLENIDTSLVKDMSWLFDDCKKIESLDLHTFNTKNVKNMSLMFSGCRSLKELDLSSFDTSNVIDMNNMFSFVKLNILDLSSFDTSMVTNMHSMFSHSTINSLNISSFDTSNVVDMSYMFSWFESDKLDLSNFNTSNVEDMYLMFEWADIKELDISTFNTLNVKSIMGMFGSPNEYIRTIDVSHFDLSNAEDITTIDDLFIETLP